MLRVLREWVLARSAPASPLARLCAASAVPGFCMMPGWLGCVHDRCRCLLLCACVCFASSVPFAHILQARSRMSVRCIFTDPGMLLSLGLFLPLPQMMKITSIMIILAQSGLSAVRADESANGPSVAAMLEQMQEQIAKLEDKMTAKEKTIAAKDETIASLKAALQSKAEHSRQVQLTAGGEVMQLVSEADFKELAARVAKCENTNADQDAKLGMTMDTLSKVRKGIKDGRVDAPPALPLAPPPPLPPPRPRPVGAPGRRLQSSSNGNFVNELSITGPNAVVSWNSHTPGLASFNCTGVGDGKLTCSGPIHAEDFVLSDGSTLSGVLLQLAAIASFVNLNPPASPPPPSAPPLSQYDTCQLIITAIRSTSENDLHFAEWVLYNDAGLSNAIELTLEHFSFCPTSGTSSSCNGAGWSQGGDMALDGVDSTKAYCQAPHHSQCGVVLQVTFLPTDVQGYDIVTANAREGRDPTSWQINCRENGQPWTTLAEVTNFAAPSARYASYGPQAFP